jgi:hypothetical protein
MWPTDEAVAEEIVTTALPEFADPLTGSGVPLAAM